MLPGLLNHGCSASLIPPSLESTRGINRDEVPTANSPPRSAHKPYLKMPFAKASIGKRGDRKQTRREVIAHRERWAHHAAPLSTVTTSRSILTNSDLVLYGHPDIAWLVPSSNTRNAKKESISQTQNTPNYGELLACGRTPRALSVQSGPPLSGSDFRLFQRCLRSSFVSV